MVGVNNNNNKQIIWEYPLFYVVTEYNSACDSTINVKPKPEITSNKITLILYPMDLDTVVTFQTPRM